MNNKSSLLQGVLYGLCLVAAFWAALAVIVTVVYWVWG